MTPPRPGTPGTRLDVHRHLSAAAAIRLLGTWHAGGPAYVALADALRAAVLAGTLAPHTRLPSERDLAAALSVSRTTTAAAYGRLRDLGFARSLTGAGTVVGLPRGADRAPATRTAGGDAPARTERATTVPLVQADLSQATSVAPSGLHAAYGRALERLPAYLGDGGYEPLGLSVLREAVAARFTARGTPTTPDEILVTTGGQHAITTVAATLLGNGDRALVQSPTYYHAMETLRRAGARLVPLPVGLGGDDGRAGLDVELLESTVRQVAPRLVYLVPDFHNPTGYTLTPAERAGVREVAARHRVTVMADETLTDLSLDTPPGDEHDPAPPLAGTGTSPYVVTVGSASKSFWGGLRVGWVRAHPDLVARLARTRQSADVATAVLEQLAVVELLEDRRAVLAERRVTLRRQRDLLCGLLGAALPWRVPVPPGGLSLWADLGAPLAHAFTAAATAEGVLLNAGPTFTPDDSSPDRVRLTFSRPSTELERAVPLLTAAWARLTG
ncbi:PLP-dependent aminotransferase family protein [Cellulosimicrobium arenosum]|uniref:PLP-dependent aminotransferase family protein n=1 Tax=Cellulosimicrobium arenosum TaxID=2708133 RepID=A0A927G4F7_9MICO|nr:PLP-dependent aminotransferase family protein [Cellulosimicrobium arenosum]MBD8077546.1 PLP-dependent aminotransferase family protein [Cellulosimicrobium arenosum]